ncbi:MAG: hypothetical protein O3A51_03735 [Verrucomicrobia bacterium]|nr:hypothetical protein [Verrucomicrobiota bacterium]
MADLKTIRDWTHEWITPSGVTATVRLKLDERRVQHFRNLNRMIGEPENWPGCYYEEYASFWAWMGGHEEIAEVVRQLAQQYRECYGSAPVPDRQYANFIKRFAASFPYQFDDKSIGHKEYAKFPIELLYDKEGDCECLSFFLASLFAHAGFRAGILGGFTKPHHQGGHAAVGLVIPVAPGDDVVRPEGTDYVFCEAVSADPVGKCESDFAVFSADAELWLVAPTYKWDGHPPGWSCPRGCGIVFPWLERCPTCGVESVFAEVQNNYAHAADWDRALQGFIDYMDWLRRASSQELSMELNKTASDSVWEFVPSGNKAYIQKTLAQLKLGGRGVESYLEGARHQLLSAWPHIVASVFCHRPRRADGEARVSGPMSWIGMSVYEMSAELGWRRSNPLWVSVLRRQA